MTAENTPSEGIGNRLRLARQMAGLSQSQVAKQLGWHRPTVSEMESGRRRVKAEELTMLSNLYAVRIAWIVGEDDPGDVNDKLIAAARELSKLKDEDLTRLMQIIQSIRVSGDDV